MQINLGYKPREWQLCLHRGMIGKRFAVLVVHRRGGKTVAAVMQLISRALKQANGTSARYAYIAPMLKQAKAVSWDYFKHFGCKIPGTKINESENWVEFPNGARVRIYGADNPDSLRGIYLDGVVLDEVAQMRPETWGEIIRPALADRNGWALFIGTPKGINLFSDTYYKALQSDDWFSGLFTVNDTDALTQDEQAALRKELSENEWRQEFLCDFSASSDDNLISIHLAEDASRRTYKTDQYDFAAKILGVDVAFADTGDRSVIFRRQGLASFEPRTWQGIKNMALADAVARDWDEWQADACMIDQGRGEGVIDRLIQMGYSPMPVNFGGSPSNPRYTNKRAEMWFDMAKWLESGGAICNNTELKRDLCAPRYDSNNAANKLQLERKDKIKERGLPSPDLGDALALTFAFPVHPKSAWAKNNTAQMEYDPLASFNNATTEYDTWN